VNRIDPVGRETVLLRPELRVRAAESLHDPQSTAGGGKDSSVRLKRHRLAAAQVRNAVGEWKHPERTTAAHCESMAGRHPDVPVARLRDLQNRRVRQPLSGAVLYQVSTVIAEQAAHRATPDESAAVLKEPSRCHRRQAAVFAHTLEDIARAIRNGKRS